MKSWRNVLNLSDEHSVTSRLQTQRWSTFHTASSAPHHRSLNANKNMKHTNPSCYFFFSSKQESAVVVLQSAWEFKILTSLSRRHAPNIHPTADSGVKWSVKSFYSPRHIEFPQSRSHRYATVKVPNTIPHVHTHWMMNDVMMLTTLTKTSTQCESGLSRYLLILHWGVSHTKGITFVFLCLSDVHVKAILVTLQKKRRIPLMTKTEQQRLLSNSTKITGK